MADVSDVDPDLRALARRVPEDIRANCSVLEPRLRCEEASSPARGSGGRTERG